MAHADDIRQLPIRRLSGLIADGALTCEAVSAAFADRVTEREADLKAWVHFDAASALAQARNADRSTAGRPLRGIPIGIKDSVDTADMPTGYGSSIYEAHRPDADASCVSILRDAGAVIFGKTALTEFAAPLPGPTRNPVNPGHTPGGSSSGSAAAVADGMVPAAIGSQTMGSLIRPAAYCGTVGFKPSFGMINRTGMKPQSETFDAIGVIARSVDDAGFVASILATVDPADWERPLNAPPRLGVFRGPKWELAEQPAIDALERSIEILQKAGAQIAEVPQPELLTHAYDVQVETLCFEMARTMAFEWHAHRNRISPLLQGWIEKGWGVSPDRHLAHQAVIEAARRSMDSAFQGFDAWITLSAPGEAPRGLEQTGDTVFNRLWSLLHLPAITIPAGNGPNRLPLGVQFVGKFRNDARLVSVARWAEDILSRELSQQSKG